MVDLDVNPVIIAAAVTVVVEVVIVPLFDACTELWAGVRNRKILYRKVPTIPQVDRTFILQAKGIYMSGSHLALLSILKKVLVICLLASEFLIDSDIRDEQCQIEERRGPGVVRQETFRDPSNITSEALVNEMPYIRRVCTQNDTRFETLFSKEDNRICGCRFLFTAVHENVRSFQAYDTKRDCSIGKFADNKTLVCKGNMIEVRPKGRTGFFLKMMEVVSDKSIRVATTDLDRTAYGDVLRLTFPVPLTSELVRLIAENVYGDTAINSLTIITGTPLLEIGSQRNVTVKTEAFVAARIPTTSIVLFASGLLILVICVAGAFLERHDLRKKDVRDRNNVQAVEALRHILSLPENEWPGGRVGSKEYDVRIFSKDAVPYHVVASLV